MKRVSLVSVVLLTLAVAVLVAQNPGPGVFSRIYFQDNTTTGPQERWGSGDPDGVVSAPKGSTYRATGTGTFWINDDGATSWVEAGAGGGGDVTGPGSSTDGNIAIFSGTGGDTLAEYAGDTCSASNFASAISADGTLTCSVPAGGGGGAFELTWNALSGISPTSNPATFNTRNTTPVLEFDTTTAESTVLFGVLPNGYGSGGITVCAHWAAATATSGTIGWTVAVERIGDSQQDIDSDGFASAQTITATTVPATSGFVDITCVNISDGANMDSLTAGESFRLQVTRDVSNDNAAGDAQLVAVTLVEQ